MEIVRGSFGVFLNDITQKNTDTPYIYKSCNIHNATLTITFHCNIVLTKFYDYKNGF
jgi:hypothetical protein